MKKTLITSVTAFAIVLSAGASMAGPRNDHGQFAKAANHTTSLSAQQGAQNSSDRSHYTGMKSLGRLQADNTYGTIQQTAEQKAHDMSGDTYIGAFAFAVGASLEFKAWKDNPSKPPIGRNFAGVKAARIAKSRTSQSN